MCFSTYADADLVVDRAGWLVVGRPAPATCRSRRTGSSTPAPGRAAAASAAARCCASIRAPRRAGRRAPVAAAVVQLTAVDGPDPGFLRAFPCDQQMTDTSNVNTRGAGQYAYSSLTTVPLAADGTFCVFTYSATDVVIDVNGAWATSATARLAPATAPFRVVDTREGRGGTTIPAGGTLRIAPAAWGGGGGGDPQRRRGQRLRARLPDRARLRHAAARRLQRQLPGGRRRARRLPDVERRAGQGGGRRATCACSPTPARRSTSSSTSAVRCSPAT